MLTPSIFSSIVPWKTFAPRKNSAPAIRKLRGIHPSVVGVFGKSLPEGRLAGDRHNDDLDEILIVQSKLSTGLASATSSSDL